MDSNRQTAVKLLNMWSHTLVEVTNTATKRKENMYIFYLWHTAIRAV